MEREAYRGALVMDADDIEKTLKDEKHDSLIGRMIFLEGRHKKAKNQNTLFPAYLESGYLSNKHGRTWLVAVVQRVGGTISMAKIRIIEEDLNKRYRVWDNMPKDYERDAIKWDDEPAKNESDKKPDPEPKQTQKSESEGKVIPLHGDKPGLKSDLKPTAEPAIESSGEEDKA